MFVSQRWTNTCSVLHGDHLSRLLSLEADVARCTYAYIHTHIFQCEWSSNVLVFLSLHAHVYIELQGKIRCIFSWRVHPFFQWDPQNPLLRCGDLSWLGQWLASALGAIGFMVSLGLMLVQQCHKPSSIHHHFYGWDSNHQFYGWFVTLLYPHYNKWMP